MTGDQLSIECHAQYANHRILKITHGIFIMQLPMWIVNTYSESQWGVHINTVNLFTFVCGWSANLFHKLHQPCNHKGFSRRVCNHEVFHHEQFAYTLALHFFMVKIIHFYLFRGVLFLLFSISSMKIFEHELFLNHTRTGRRPVPSFLELLLPSNVCVHACVCMSVRPRGY